MTGSSWNDAVKPLYLTIGQVRAFKRGQVVEVVCFDRNFGDALYNGNLREGASFRAQELFRSMEKVDTYTHIDGVSGLMHWGFEDSEDASDSFHFDGLIEAQKMWWPFDDSGRMPKDGNKHHSEYPDELLVGWRGPMIPFDKLAEAPDVRVRFSGFDFKLEAGDADIDEPEESDDSEIHDLQTRKDAAGAEYRRLNELVKQSKREEQAM